MTLYYVPAPAKTSAILRDVIVMLALRPFFGKVVLHWHAVGLGEWCDRKNGSVTSRVLRKAVKKLLSHVDLAISLTRALSSDARVFAPKTLKVIPNGIPDPCPNFESVLRSRWTRRSENPPEFRILFLARKTKDKGVFDALEAVTRLAEKPEFGRTPIRFKIVGADGSEEETERLRQLCANPLSQNLSIELDGFAKKDEKARLFAETDCLFVPSKHESFGLTLIEGMAWGLSICASDLGVFREVLEDVGEIGSVDDPESLSEALMRAHRCKQAPAEVRARFLDLFEESKWRERMIQSLAALEA